MVFQTDFLALGLEIAGFRRWKNHSNETNCNYFWSVYGASALTCEQIWRDLATMVDRNNNALIDSASQPLFLLLTLRWFKTYKTEIQLSGRFSMSPNTVRKYISAYSLMLQSLKDKKVCIDICLLLHFFLHHTNTTCF